MTIALDANFDDKTRRLLDVINPQPDSIDEEDSLHIVAVQVVPSESNGGLASSQPTNENIVYQTVSLEGIANVPRVLLEGDMIRFVIPAETIY